MDDSGKHDDPMSDSVEQESVPEHENKKSSNPDYEPKYSKEENNSRTVNDEPGDSDSGSSSEFSGVSDPIQDNFEIPEPEPADEAGNQDEIDLLANKYSQDGGLRDSDSEHPVSFDELEAESEEDDLFDLFGEDFEVPSEMDSLSDLDRSSDRSDPTNAIYDDAEITDREDGPSWRSDVAELLEDVSDSDRGSDFHGEVEDETRSDSKLETETDFDEQDESQSQLLARSDLGSPDTSDDLAGSGWDVSVGYEAGQDLEASASYSERGSRSEKDFASILNEEEAGVRSGESMDRSNSNSELGAAPGSDARRVDEYALDQYALDAETELDEDPRVTIGSGIPDPGRMEGEKSDIISPTIGSNVRQKPNKPEGPMMRWLTTGISVVLGIVVIVMGVFLFNLQSQVDELRSLLPSGSDDLFENQASTPTDLANEAVIENINARIDNLADTLELIANANQRDVTAPNGAMPLQSDSETSGPREPDPRNRAAAVLAGREEINQINRRLTGLDQSLAEIDRAVAQQGLKIKGLEALRNTESSTPAVKVDRSLPTEKVKAAEKAAKSQAAAKSGKAATSTSSVPVATKASISNKSQAPRNTALKGAWSVNLMSFPNQATAKQELEKIRNKGVSADLESAVVSGRTWYRIRVRGFKSKQEAQKYAKTVAKKLGLASTWVTR